MSPLLLTCCVLFLAAFCVLAYVIEHWSFWKSTGPRRWGWIQSLGKKLETSWKRWDQSKPNPRWSTEDWANWAEAQRQALEATIRMRKMDELRKIKNEKFPQHIIDRVETDIFGRSHIVNGIDYGYKKYSSEDQYLADLIRSEKSSPKPKHNDLHVWNTTNQALQLYTDGWRCGRFTETGNQTLFRGESEAYVSIEVWSEVERLTKAKWDELHGKPIPNYPLGTDYSPERRAVVGEKGKETINWAVGRYPNRENILFKDGTIHEVPTGKPMFWDGSTLKEQVPETIEEALKRLGVEVLPSRFPDEQLTAAMAKADRWLKRHKTRFLPSVNPLGDTGAFMSRTSVNRILFCDRTNRSYETNFRHKKGGSRG